MIKNNQTVIVVVLYLGISAMYNAFGDPNQIYWIITCYLLDNLTIAWAVTRASKYAMNTQSILLGYSFAVYKLLESLVLLFAWERCNGTIDNFWQIVNGSSYELFMLISSMVLVWTSKLLSKIF